MPGNSPLRGDIYHVRFEPPVGKHYAVVVTADAINAYSDSLVVAVITTKHMDRIYPHQVKIPKGVLDVPAKVKCDNLMMWPKGELSSNTYVATIPKRDMPGLDMALLNALDLWH